MTDDQIKDRIDGRRIADEILALAAPAGESKEWAVAFWCQVGMKLHEAEKLLKIATMPPRPKLIPMSDKLTIEEAELRQKLAAAEAERDRLKAIVAETYRRCDKEMDDPTQGPFETCCKMMEHVEAAEKASAK